MIYLHSLNYQISLINDFLKSTYPLLGIKQLPYLGIGLGASVLRKQLLNASMIF
jgi:hypothetical protein